MFFCWFLIVNSKKDLVLKLSGALAEARRGFLGAAAVKIVTDLAQPNDVRRGPEDLFRNTGMIITQTKRARAIPIHCPGINASVYFLARFGVIENVFQAAHAYADCGGSEKSCMSQAFFFNLLHMEEYAKTCNTQSPADITFKK